MRTIGLQTAAQGMPIFVRARNVAMAGCSGDRLGNESLRPKGHTLSLRELADSVAVGAVLFIRIRGKPFREVAIATGSWTNHVGVVVASGACGVTIAESAFPFARLTSLARFVRRSEQGRVAVARLKVPLTGAQVERLSIAVERRLGTFYDTGFNLRSRRQFCSRFVHEVLREATGLNIGEVETFSRLLARHPSPNLRFWTAWFFGRIPWARETVTPASLLESPKLKSVFDGRVELDSAASH
jgi:hypothetical protein